MKTRKLNKAQVIERLERGKSVDIALINKLSLKAILKIEGYEVDRDTLRVVKISEHEEAENKKSAEVIETASAEEARKTARSYTLGYRHGIEGAMFGPPYDRNFSEYRAGYMEYRAGYMEGCEKRVSEVSLPDETPPNPRNNHFARQSSSAVDIPDYMLEMHLESRLRELNNYCEFCNDVVEGEPIIFESYKCLCPACSEYLQMSLCNDCGKAFEPRLDDEICDDCMKKVFEEMDEEQAPESVVLCNSDQPEVPTPNRYDHLILDDPITIELPKNLEITEEDTNDQDSPTAQDQDSEPSDQPEVSFTPSPSFSTAGQEVSGVTLPEIRAKNNFRTPDNRNPFVPLMDEIRKNHLAWMGSKMKEVGDMQRQGKLPGFILIMDEKIFHTDRMVRLGFTSLN